MLLALATGRSQEWLVAHGPEVAGSTVADRFLELVERRMKGEPMAYLTGVREFYGRPFALSTAVLIPRPETELLVDVALELLKDVRSPCLLDLGTGTGILAVSLALERPDATVFASDLSPQALKVAGGNAAALGADPINFLCGDWWHALGDEERPFDLVVANPPYVAIGDRHLEEGDLRFEPGLALVGGCDGLTALRRIIAGAPARLGHGAWLVVEHGLEQGAFCRQLMAASGFDCVVTRRDLEHRERVTFGRMTGVPTKHRREPG